MILNSDIPAAFMAVSSKFSPRFPKVIKDARSIAKGNAMGMRESMAYIKNSLKTDQPTPLPTNSVTCFHKNCINKMKMQMRKVIKNSVIKRLNM